MEDARMKWLENKIDTENEKGREAIADSNTSTISASGDQDLEATPESMSLRPNIETQASTSPELRPKTSRASSVRFDAEIVPRSHRRGLLSRFSALPEVVVPYDYANSTKWLITFIVSIAAAAAPMGSAILLPALQPITKEFETSATITNLNVALYMLSMSIFPLWWSSFSETLGRRTVYIISFALFTLFGILSAIATNIAMLIVMRLLSGGAAASVQAVGAGTIADIWEPQQRGRAMGMFYIGPLCGPMLAPVVGGALTQGLGWRSTMWLLVIYGCILEIILILCLPETLRKRRSIAPGATTSAVLGTASPDSKPAGEQLGTANQSTDPKPDVQQDVDLDQPESSLQRIMTMQSTCIRAKHVLVALKRFFVDPLKIILLMRFPAVFITVFNASITFGALYFLNISIETTFSQSPYGFSTLIIGLVYLPPSIGYLISSVLGGRWLDHIMKREAKKAGRYHPQSGRLIFRPEDRMRENAWLGCLMFPVALIWYGWAVEFQLHAVVPLIANFFFGCGSMVVFSMSTTMLTEFLPGRASMGIACNNFLRNIFSCVGGVIASPLIDAIGNGWLCTILGFVSLCVGVSTILCMKRYGTKWRDRMEDQLKDW